MKKEILLQLGLLLIILGIVSFYSFRYQQQQTTLSSIIIPTSQFNSSNTTSGSILLTSSEINKHNLGTNCWLIIENQVYDVTHYLSIHPGGANRIIPYCGQDATAAFLTKGGQGSHSQQAIQQLGLLYLGKLNDSINQQTIDNVNTSINNSVNNGKLNRVGGNDDD